MALTRTHLPWIALVGMGCGVAILALSLSNRDERIVRRQLTSLARLCEKKSGQSALRSLSGAGDVRAFFTSNAIIRLGRPYPLSTTPREFSALVARAHHEVEWIQITIQGIEFLPAPAKELLELRTAVEIKIHYNDRTEQQLEEYRLRWRKSAGTWRIEFVAVDDTIRPVNTVVDGIWP